MQFLILMILSALITVTIASTNNARWPDINRISPKIVIISMFPPEAGAWYGIPEFDVLAQNISVPGLSPLYPDLHCTASGEVCQVTTGESEINAAVTMSSLVAYPFFNFTTTYFFVAGIAGANPEVLTIGSVAFAKYAVQVALQYELDAREMPSNWSTGYVPLGSTSPGIYPQSIYGTEVFEVNEALRDLAVGFAKTAVLNDSSTAVAYRALYNTTPSFAPATLPPSIVSCDVATSDAYYSGDLLAEAFANTTYLYTNGSGIYCMTAQEDNASLAALLRGAKAGKVDFSRIIVMRSGSNFDRPYAGESAIDNLLYVHSGGFAPSVENVYLAGIKVVEGILEGWEETFKSGVKATNYIGDIFGTLGGTPDFGLGNAYNDDPTAMQG